MRSALLAAFAALCAAGGSSAQEPPLPPEPPAPAEAQLPPETALPPEGDVAERIVGPTEGAPTMSLAAAVRLALERNFGLLDSVDAVNATRWQEKAALGQFFPTVTPVFQRSDDRTVFGVDLAQTLPWTGGTP